MMTKYPAIKFPSIQQYRHAIESVRMRAQYTGRDADEQPIYDESLPVPTLMVQGTVKLHGACAGVYRNPGDGALVAMSHTRVITPDDDYKGFARFVQANAVAFTALFDHLHPVIGSDKPITLYGEWCGKGIFRGCGIHQLDKMFMLFAIRVGAGDETVWLNIDEYQHVHINESRIFNIASFGVYFLQIDFANPESAQAELAEITNRVEAECPVAKKLGVGGVGEGVVWRIQDPLYQGSQFWFKVKGEKHAVVKTKERAPIDVAKVASVEAFVDAVVTEPRLEQGIEYLREQGLDVSRKSTGDYLRWVFNDVLKEESDQLAASGLTKKDIGSALSKLARTWYFAWLDGESLKQDGLV